MHHDPSFLLGHTSLLILQHFELTSEKSNNRLNVVINFIISTFYCKSLILLFLLRACLCISLPLFALFRLLRLFLCKLNKNLKYRKTNQQQRRTKTIRNYELFFFELPENYEHLLHILQQTCKTHRHLHCPCFTAIYAFLRPSLIIFLWLSYVLKDSGLHSMCFVFFNYKVSLEQLG